MESGVYNHLVSDVYRITQAIDPTRPVNDVSGDGHVKTDIWSVHNLCCFPNNWKIFIVY